MYELRLENETYVNDFVVCASVQKKHTSPSSPQCECSVRRCKEVPALGGWIIHHSKEKLVDSVCKTLTAL